MKYVISSNKDRSYHVAAKHIDGIVTVIYSGKLFTEALSAIHKDANLDITWLRE